MLKRGVKVHTYEGSGAFGELSLLAERATRAATVIAETEVATKQSERARESFFLFF